MNDSMSAFVMLHSKKEKLMEQEKERHEKDSNCHINLFKEDIGAVEWEVNEREQEHDESLVEDEEDNPTREEAKS